jgi:predicted acyl esterase
MTNLEPIYTQFDDPARQQDEFHEGLLKRDQYRCVVTGAMDYAERIRLGRPPEITRFDDVEGVHITPLSYGSWDDQKAADTKEIAKTWEVFASLLPDNQSNWLWPGRHQQPCQWHVSPLRYVFRI